MFIADGTQARVFDPREEPEKRKRTVLANLSTYEGKDKNGKYRYSSWWTHFVGDAYEKAKKLSNKDQVVLRTAKIESIYNKELEAAFITLTVFDFEVVGQSSDEQ